MLLLFVVQLLRELMVWTYLEHPNIVPLLGLSLSHSPYASMVSPWYEKGNVHRYLETFADIIGISDRLRLVILCFSQTTIILKSY